MQKITPDSLLSDLLIQEPLLLPFLHFTGIRGSLEGKTIKQICKERAVNESYLINLVSICLDEAFLPSETLPSYGILQLVTLISYQYPYMIEEFNRWYKDLFRRLKILNSSSPEVRLKNAEKIQLRKAVDRYGQALSDRYQSEIQTLIPHVNNVYEWYYSPDYTSEQPDLMNYSLDFYDGKTVVLQADFEALRMDLEHLLKKFPGEINLAKLVLDFSVGHRAVLVQDRVEQKLLKPLVLQMEESIIGTFRKKNKGFKRNNFVTLPGNIPTSESLSSREKEVLTLVAQGFMNKEIAERLNIGITTVITHRKNLAEKLGIKSIPGLTVYAYTQGYLDDLTLEAED